MIVFCGDFLATIKKLRIRNRKNYTVNSPKCTINYLENDEELFHTVYVENNKIKTILKKPNKSIIIDGSYHEFTLI